MKISIKGLISVIIVIIFAGLCSGFSIMLGEGLFDPVIADVSEVTGIVWTSKTEEIGWRVLQGTGILIIWFIFSLFGYFIITEMLDN